MAPSRITSSWPSSTTMTSTSAPPSTETRICPSTFETMILPSTPPPTMMMEFTPPPRAIKSPFTTTLSSVTVPEPTPSAMIKSPLMVTSFNVVPGTFTMTLPSATTSVTVPEVLIYCLAMLFIITANSALVIFFVGLNFPPLPCTYPSLTRAPIPSIAHEAT